MPGLSSTNVGDQRPNQAALPRGSAARAVGAGTVTLCNRLRGASAGASDGARVAAFAYEQNMGNRPESLDFLAALR